MNDVYFSILLCLTPDDYTCQCQGPRLITEVWVATLPHEVCLPLADGRRQRLKIYAQVPEHPRHNNPPV